MKVTRPTRILFIGNSFTNRNDLPGLLTELAASAKPPRVVETQRVIANGMSLKAHWNKGEALGLIRQGGWDYVVLQEQSTLPLKNATRMHESVTLFDAEIKRSGAKTALYMTWARRTEFQRQGELAEAYMSIGQKLGAVVVPVGLTWQRAIKADPNLVLHDKDNSHPNIAGSYIAACVFYATLLKRTPVGLAAKPSSLDAKVAAELQAVAWETTSRMVGHP